jgi:hypothetical protein
MLNCNNISWKSPAFFNACTVRSIQAHKKYECFDQTWYQENYRKIFFEHVVLMAKGGNSKAKIILDECSQDTQFLIESILIDDSKKYPPTTPKKYPFFGR